MGSREHAAPSRGHVRGALFRCARLPHRDMLGDDPCDPNNMLCEPDTCCPLGNTCCDIASGGVGCCPYVNAKCCPDGVHCCLEWMECSPPGSSSPCTYDLKPA